MPLPSKKNRSGTAGVPYELEFSLAINDVVDIGNPYKDVQANVLVEGPDATPIEIPVFWYSDNIWKARLTPESCGTYHFRVIASGRKIQSYEGAFRVEPYEGDDNPLFTRGGIQVSSNGKYLTYRDGTPFFWLGDTWWYGATKRCSWPETFKLLTEDRVNKGFSVIQLVVGTPPEISPEDDSAANEGGFPFLRMWDLINPRYFKYVDRRIHYLVQRGLVPCLLGGWGHHIEWMGEEAMVEYWRYLVARYSAYPVIWCLSGESDYFPPPKEARTRQAHLFTVVSRRIIDNLPVRMKSIVRRERRRFQKNRLGRNQQLASRRDAWTRVGEIVSRNDPFDRIITTHPLPGIYSHESLKNAPWVGMTNIQSGHSETAAYPMVEFILKASNLQPRRPIVNMEPWYEGILGKFWQEDQRYAMWMCILSGACGHTYGAHGVWQMSTEQDAFRSNWGQSDWREAYQQAGSRQVGIAREFLSEFRWWELEPKVDWIEPHWGRGHERMPLLASIKDELYLVYFPSTESRYQATVSQLSPVKRYRSFWFDPRTGEVHIISKDLFMPTGQWDVPSQPNQDDWVLVLKTMTLQ